MNFWRGVFSDNGQPSFSRVGTGVALGFACGWVTAIVVKTHVLPDFAGICMFIGILYGTNVAANAAAKFSNKEGDKQ